MRGPVILLDADSRERVGGLSSVFMAVGRADAGGLCCNSFMAKDFEDGAADADQQMQALGAMIGHVLFTFELCGGLEPEARELFWPYLHHKANAYRDAMLAAGAHLEAP